MQNYAKCGDDGRVKMAQWGFYGHFLAVAPVGSARRLKIPLIYLRQFDTTSNALEDFAPTFALQSEMKN